MDVAIRNAAPAQQAALSDLHRRSSYVWEEDRVHLDAHPRTFGFYQRVGFAVGETVNTRFGPAAALRRELQ